MARFILSLIAILAIVVVVSASLEVSVRIDKTEILSGSPLLARVSMLNPLDTPVTVLTWFTPLEGARSDMFRLVHANGGLSAMYTGMLLKRQFPAPIEAYTTFAAGEVRHVVIPLHDSYHFMTSGAHDITLVAFFNGFIGEVAKLDSEQFDFEVEVVSTPVRVAVRNASADALFSRLPVGTPETLHADAITYNGCSSTQTSGIQNALPIAQSDATQAYNYLVAAKCNGNYVTWFGTSTSSRYSTVQSHFQKIVAQLKSNNFKFDCTCNQAGVFAYVYPFDPSFTIYLCPAFWTAPTGSHQYNSRPGTLTHETSHFKAVAGTDDIQYGEAGCKRLAQTSPNDAVKNADSHEYFQESNPRC